MRREILMMCFALTVAACSTALKPTTVHGLCVQRAAGGIAPGGFVSYANCMQSVTLDPTTPDRVRRHQPTQLMIAYSQALRAKVLAGQISDGEAQYEMARLGYRLEQEQRDRADKSLESVQRYAAEQERLRQGRYPNPGISCRQIGDSFVCN